MTKWLKKLWFKLTYDEIALKCSRPLGKSLFIIIVLMSTICSAQTSILTYDANGVTRLYARLNRAATVTPDANELVYPPNPVYIGIPEPSFGINETYRMYDYEPNQNPELTYYDSPDVGKYTHYVDSTDPNSTPNGVPAGFGSPAHPRKAPPINIPAGSIIEIHNDSLATAEGHILVGGEGTAEHPIFIRGVGNPDINLRLSVGYIANSSYIIVEGVRINRGTMAARSSTESFDTNHICYRNCEIASYSDTYGGFAISGDTKSANQTHNVVLYNCSIHNNGLWDWCINSDIQFDFMEYEIDEDAQTVWSGEGVTVTTSTTAITPLKYPTSSYSLSCAVDATGNRSLTKTQSKSLTTKFDSFSFYHQCDTASSSFQFYIKDSSGNISYYNVTTSGTPNTWASKSAYFASPNSNNGANANKASIVEYGFVGLDANVTYLFDYIRVDGDPELGGVNIEGNCSYVWVLDCEMSYNCYNAVQVGKTTPADATNAPDHVYLGGNISHHNSQNGFAVKTAYDVVISQNISYTPMPSASGCYLYQYDPQRVWYLFNTAYNAYCGFRNGGSDKTFLHGPADEIYYIGNVVYDCNGAFAINGSNDGYTFPILMNTIYNCEFGVGTYYYETHSSFSAGSLNIFNNIIVNNDYGLVVGGIHNPQNYSSFDYNLVYNNNYLKWGSDYETLAALIAGTTQGDNCLEADPLFVNADANDFDLQSTSPAIGMTISPDAQAVYDRFEELYGITDLNYYCNQLFIQGVQNAPSN